MKKLRHYHPMYIFHASKGSWIRFWATACKTVRPMLSDHCLSVLSVCDVGVLWPNDWMDQDATWYGGRPRSRRHCVRWGPSFPTPRKGTLLGTCPLWPNGRLSQQLLSSCRSSGFQPGTFMPIRNGIAKRLLP